MRRRNFLTVPAAFAAGASWGCEVGAERQPWLLWGSKESIDVRITTGPFASPAVSDQLAKVSYHRPDTWAFLFSVETIGVGPGDPVITPAPFDFTVNFNVAAGIGRSRFISEDNRAVGSSVANHESFAQFRFSLAAGDNVAGRKKWSSVGRTPVLDDLAATPERSQVDYLVAQDIQSWAVANGTGIGSPPNVVRVSVGAFFAPLTHVRPDWFAEDAEQFSGGQLGGT